MGLLPRVRLVIFLRSLWTVRCLQKPATLDWIGISAGFAGKKAFESGIDSAGRLGLTNNDLLRGVPQQNEGKRRLRNSKVMKKRRDSNE